MKKFNSPLHQQDTKPFNFHTTPLFIKLIFLFRWFFLAGESQHLLPFCFLLFDSFITWFFFFLHFFDSRAQVHPNFYFFVDTLSPPSTSRLRNYTAPSTEAQRHCCVKISLTSKPPSKHHSSQFGAEQSSHHQRHVRRSKHSELKTRE